jgi:hypothetical protein
VANVDRVDVQRGDIVSVDVERSNVDRADSNSMVVLEIRCGAERAWSC